VVRDVPAAWAIGLVSEIDGGGEARILRKRLPKEAGEGWAIVKLYGRRRGHSLWRRFRRGRAVAEGRGYVEVAARGVPTPPILLWGERRRFGLHETGLVATGFVDAYPVARTYRRTRNEDLLSAAVAELAFLHRAGLCHGDPRARNFLATRPRPTMFDLPSWSELTVAGQVEDLTRLLGSVVTLDGGPRLLDPLLEVYRSRMGELPAPAPDLRRRSEAFAAG